MGKSKARGPEKARGPDSVTPSSNKKEKQWILSGVVNEKPSRPQKAVTPKSLWTDERQTSRTPR